MAKASPTKTTPITLSQQSLSMLKSMINNIGWSKDLTDITVGGYLLTKGLPELDSTDWVLGQAELAKLTKEQAEAYIAKDQAWGAKPVTFPLNADQKAVSIKAFKHWLEAAAQQGKLGPAPWLTELIEALNLTPGEGKAE